MNLQTMMPSLGEKGLMNLLAEGRWHVDHGSIDRFPEFLQPKKQGAISNINQLGQWRHFDIGYRDANGKYHQVNGAGNSAQAYYDMGALVRSTSIEEVTDQARHWLNDWAETLGVSRQDLRLNSWAVKGANGIHWHLDPEDVIHFQIKGDKLFKFLRTPHTRNADSQTKRLEKMMVESQDFSKAEEEIVREGSITIIPRGVWHWSEGKSDESFAVALCVNPPSAAMTLTQALYKKLRLLEQNRTPMLGDGSAQLDAMEECLKEATALLKTMNAQAMLAQEGRLKLPMERVDSLHFRLSSRAHVKLDPLRMWVDGQQLSVQVDEEARRGFEESLQERRWIYSFRTSQVSAEGKSRRNRANFKFDDEYWIFRIFRLQPQLKESK